MSSQAKQQTLTVQNKMAKELPTFQRQVRQLRNLLEDKAVGYEKVTQQQQDLLARLGPVPGPAKDEPRLLALFAGKGCDDWLRKWEVEATKVLATGASKSADSGGEASSSTVNTQQPSILKSAANFILGGPKDKSPLPEAKSTTQPTSAQPPTSQGSTPPPATPQPSAAQPATSQPPTPGQAATQATTSAQHRAPAGEEVQEEETSTIHQPAVIQSQSPTPRPAAAQVSPPKLASPKPASPQTATPQPTASLTPRPTRTPFFTSLTERRSRTSSIDWLDASPTERRLRTAFDWLNEDAASAPPPASEPEASAQDGVSRPVTTTEPATSTLRADSQPARSTHGASSTQHTVGASQPAASQPAASQPTTPQPTQSQTQRAGQATGNTGGPPSRPATAITIGSSPPAEPAATETSGNGRQRESPPSRSGARAAQGQYTSPLSPSYSDPGDNATETGQDPGLFGDGSEFDPDQWEEAVGVDRHGFVVRPDCFESAVPNMPSKRSFPELWHKVHDPIDGNRKWALLIGKVRKNSLAFEVPSSDGSRFTLLPAKQYNDVSIRYLDDTGENISEVRYGNAKGLLGIDLTEHPPHKLCFALGKGLKRRGDTYFIWFAPDAQWYPKDAVIAATSTTAVNAFLDGKVPDWNEPRHWPGGPPPPPPPPREQLPTPRATPAREALPRTTTQHRDAQRPRATREHLQSQRQAHAAAPGPTHPSTRHAAPLHPIYEGFPPGNGASGTGQIQLEEATRRNYGGQNYTQDFPGGQPPGVTGSSWYPFQSQPSAFTAQAPGQASSVPWQFGFPPNPAQVPMFQEQGAPGLPPWVPWAPVYPPGYQHAQVSQPLTVPPQSQYNTRNRERRETSHLPTPPRDMGYERGPPHGSRQGSAAPVQGTANPGPYRYQRGGSAPFW